MKKGILVLLVLLISSLSYAQGSRPGVQYFNPSSYSVCEGEEFVVYSYIKSNQWSGHILGIHCEVSFDTDMLELDYVSPGAFITGQSCNYLFSDDSTSDYGDFYNAWLGCLAEGYGVYAELHFTALAAGTTDITYELSDWRNNQNASLSHLITDGSVTVNVCGPGQPPGANFDQAASTQTSTFSTIKSLY